MTIQDQHNIIIVGCGRVGTELAISLCCKQHRVTVMDANAQALQRLGPEFTGRTVQGDGMDREALKRAGIHQAHALAAVTSSDSVNIVVARTAQQIYNVPRVVARVYNPRRAPVYQKLGLQTIASSSWAAQRIEELILRPGMRHLHGVGSGEVQVYELEVPSEWNGRRISDVLPPQGALALALTRGGHAFLPTPDTVLQTHDLLQVSVTDSAAEALRITLNHH
ncbi:MAG: NAD-binding protein [Anaerolineales bacterium]|nr:NAD-binding protein [Anaerolineales bacterium]